jgi:hypothetical protein
MTTRDRPWTRLFHVTCGLLLITAVGCCRHPRPQQPPPPPTCDSKQQNGTGQLTASASTIVEKKQFTANFTRSVAVSPNGAGAGSESHLVVQRSVRRCRSTKPPTTSLQIDTQTTPNGALQLMLRFGKGFHGVKEIMFTSADRVTVQGTINGRPIAPFPINADPRSIKFADGSAIPATRVDDETRRALPILVHAIHGQCAQTTGSIAPAVRIPAGDQPAHPPNFDTAGCIQCSLKGGLDWVGCVYDAFDKADVCLVLYPVCLGYFLVKCEIDFADYLGNTCHLLRAPNFTPGPPCCPTLCGPGGWFSNSSCCGPGESCAGPNPNPLGGFLCCSSGLTGCGQNCCAAGETCVGGGTCCVPPNVCGQNCCSAGQTCLANGTCCDPGNVCGGQNCCNTGDQCLSNGTCCPAGRAVCNGVCCPEFNICDPTTNSCVVACPGGCPAGQICCVEVHPSGARDAKCFFDRSQPGLPWCESADPAHDPTAIFCRQCPTGKRCAPICQRASCGIVLCSTDQYCQ